MSAKSFSISVYLILLTIGGTVHLVDIFQNGWLPDTYFPLWMNWYWTSLLFFDYAAVFLLLRWRNAGLIAALTIMLSNVAVNTHAHNLVGGDIYWGYIAQTLFLGFILGSISWLWEHPVQKSDSSDTS